MEHEKNTESKEETAREIGAGALKNEQQDGLRVSTAALTRYIAGLQGGHNNLDNARSAALSDEFQHMREHNDALLVATLGFCEKVFGGSSIEGELVAQFVYGAMRAGAEDGVGGSVDSGPGPDLSNLSYQEKLVALGMSNAD